MLLLRYRHIWSIVLHQHTLCKYNIILGNCMQKFTFVCGSQHSIWGLRWRLLEFLFLLIICVSICSCNISWQELNLHCLIWCKNCCVWTTVIVHLLLIFSHIHINPWIRFLHLKLLILGRQLRGVETWLIFGPCLKSHEWPLAIITTFGVPLGNLLIFRIFVHLKFICTTNKRGWNQSCQVLVIFIVVLLNKYKIRRETQSGMYWLRNQNWALNVTLNSCNIYIIKAGLHFLKWVDPLV